MSLVRVPENELAPDAEPVLLRKSDRVLDLLEGDPLFDREEHVRIAALDAELEQLEVGRLEQADELVVDAVDACLRGETNATVEAAVENPGQDRLRPPHVEAEGLVLDPDPARTVALENLVDLVEHVRRCSVPRLEARVVRAEHTPERAAAVRDQRQRVGRPEQVPGGVRE